MCNIHVLLSLPLLFFQSKNGKIYICAYFTQKTFWAVSTFASNKIKVKDNNHGKRIEPTGSHSLQKIDTQKLQNIYEDDR